MLQYGYGYGYGYCTVDTLVLIVLANTHCIIKLKRKHSSISIISTYNTSAVDFD